MESCLNALAAQKVMALFPFLLQIVSKSSKNLMYVVYLKALKKMRQRNVKIKSVPTEYFEDLLTKNTYSNISRDDVKSYCLLNINSLYALSAENESWIEIRQCSGIGEKNNQEEYSNLDADMGWELCGQSELPYMIQCFAVSSIKEDLVLYVTHEKYFNIIQHFNMTVTVDPVLEVRVRLCDAKIYPEIAEKLLLSLIESPFDNEISVEKVKAVVQKFFKTSKYLNVGEVFQVDLRKMLRLPGLNYFNVENLCFKVLKIFGTTNVNVNFGTSPEGTLGFYVSEKETDISLAIRGNGFMPMSCTKYIPLDGRIGYEITMCPGGLDGYYSELEKLFKIFLDGRKLKFKPMILMSGVKGSGKRTVLNCIAKRFGLNLYNVDCFDFVGLDASALELKLNGIMQKLRNLSPVILFMSNIELLGRDEQYSESMFAVEVFKNQIEALYWDNLKFPIVIVASTSQKTMDMVPSLQRMFIKTISFGALKKEEVHPLLKWLVNEVGMTCLPEVLKKVVDRVHGYLFADLTKLMRLALKFQRQDASLPEECKLLITEDHWEKGIQIMEALYSDSIGTAKVPSVHWEDVGGLDHVKEEITHALEFPTKYPELMDSGLRASGFLFFGPPGTGKTLMAKAVATEFNYNFLSVKGPELMNMYVGQSEKNVREVFRRARDAAPCVIFFDELDSLAPNRGRSSGSVTDRIVSQLLTEMDGLESNRGVFVIGATNRPDLVDPALLRPGRFDKMFYVGVCESFDSKCSVLKALTRRFSLADDVDLGKIVRNFPAQVTGADIYSICSNAWLEAARKCIHQLEGGTSPKLPVTVSLNDFKFALSNFVPSLTPDIVRGYEKYMHTDQQ